MAKRPPLVVSKPENVYVGTEADWQHLQQFLSREAERLVLEKRKKEKEACPK